ncbi:hypothetical protein C8J56DRAFT_1164670, partial [Mycena floridula]
MSDPMDIDPIDTDLEMEELDDYSEDHIVELLLTPPIHHNDVHRMLRADCVRLETPLPSRLEDRLPGYYYKGPGELFVVSGHSPSRSKSSRSTDTVENSTAQLVQRTLVKARIGKDRMTDPYPRRTVAKSTGPGRSFSVNSCPVFRNISNLNPTPQVRSGRVMMQPNERDHPQSYQQVEERDMLFNDRVSFNPCITEIVTAVSNVFHPEMDPYQALYTTQMSWGDSESESCVIVMETGTSLSWVLKRGFLRLPDVFWQENSPNTPLMSWGMESKDLVMVRYARSVCFEHPSDDLREYPIDRCITYGDKTAVATVHFKDAVTFEDREGEHGPLTVKAFPFRAAIATNELLLPRIGYDGVLGLGPELSPKEKHIVRDEDPHARETLLQSLLSRGIILVRSKLTTSYLLCRFASLASCILPDIRVSGPILARIEEKMTQKTLGPIRAFSA